MKVSLSWLKNYINIDKSAENISEFLTNCGLEVEKVESYETIKGGLKGLVVGEVLSVEKHPNADKLSCCKVNVGTEVLDIVCGAPNVANGQKVVVATVGTKLYPTDGEPFEIKKSKIRGEESYGMICAEDEVGIGSSHDGIMVLPAETQVGTLVADLYNITSDTVFDIAITPNRGDATSHLGTARDLYAVLKQNKSQENITFSVPEVKNFAIESKSKPISVEVQNPEACIRYSGILVDNVTVEESPQWLRDCLSAVGIRPHNNIVDITNYILMDLGQPLHAFDYDKISGNAVVVKKLEHDTPFVTLDEVERKLTSQDLMICSSSEPMCIAGVFGGIDSSITDKTTTVFIESACFDPVHIRKTARHHGLSTDASFRYERGTDPNITIYALKKAAMMMKEVAGGNIASEIIDVYPNPVQKHSITVTKQYIDNLIGVEIDMNDIVSILKSLDFEVELLGQDELKVLVPTAKVEVLQPADVVEEILRIYGYNNVPFYDKVSSSLSYGKKPDGDKLRTNISKYLSANGFVEVLNNSLTASKYYENNDSYPLSKCAKVLNAQSSEFNVMRQTLLYSVLENVAFNINRQNSDLMFFEFGNVYRFNADESEQDVEKKYWQNSNLAVLTTGNVLPTIWNNPHKQADFYHLKSFVEAIIKKSGIPLESLTQTDTESGIFAYGQTLSQRNDFLAHYGELDEKVLKNFGIKQKVFYAEINWQMVLSKAIYAKQSKITLSKYPIVERDLAFIIDKNIKYSDLENAAFKLIKKPLLKVILFDVYEGKQIADDKKSYALRFQFINEEKTFTDSEIDGYMDSLMNMYQKQYGAVIRK
ncbi:MAG: phenylalanine--tRNA ligase subunit beta [Lentimicrobiaceae bacterium]|nr:phenylalanine--tRNA ligase subunit beta [Lentimicrobiaceae bacterium]